MGLYASKSKKQASHSSLFFQNSSQKVYLLHQATQRQFQQKRAFALKQRQKELKKIKKQRALKNKIEEIEFQAFIQPNQIPALNKKLSLLEESYWEHQNKTRLRQRDRKKSFYQYKKQYQKYQNKKKLAVSNQLKRTQVLRRSFKPVEITPFENL